jgi:maleamate amidohydrolase
MYDKLLNISDASKLLGISASTLRRLEKDGIVDGYGLKVIYTPGGQRRYILDEIQQLYARQGFSGQIGFGKRPAVLLRDLTLAFTDPNSKLTIELNGQIEAARQLAEAALLHHIPLVFTKTTYDPSNPISQLWGKKFPSLQVLDKDSDWLKIHPELNELAFDFIYDTVYITDLYNNATLNNFLNHKQIDTLILAGATTSGSIRATTIEALQRGYNVVIPKEAVGDRTETIQTTTLLDLNARYADVVSLEQVLKYFSEVKEALN